MPIQDDASPQLVALAEGLRSQSLLRKLALGVERDVKRDTRAGIDASGSPFKRAGSARPGSPYSPSWHRRREAAGLPTDRITLAFDTYSGMLTRIDHVLSSDLQSVRVQFTDAGKEQLARYAHDYGRVFFALSDRRADRAVQLVGEHVARLLSLKPPS